MSLILSKGVRLAVSLAAAAAIGWGARSTSTAEVQTPTSPVIPAASVTIDNAPQFRDIRNFELSATGTGTATARSGSVISIPAGKVLVVYEIDLILSGTATGAPNYPAFQAITINATATSGGGGRLRSRIELDVDSFSGSFYGWDWVGAYPPIVVNGPAELQVTAATSAGTAITVSALCSAILTDPTYVLH